MRIGYSQRRAVVVVGGATVDFARRPTTMIIIGIVLALVGLAYLCWLLFALAVYALPLFAGVTAGLATYHSGSGPIGAIIVGLIASSVTLVLAQIAFTTLRSPLIRAVIALLFAVPGCRCGISCWAQPRAHRHPGRELETGNGNGGRDRRGGHGLGVHDALCPAPDAGQGIAAGVIAPDPLTSPPRQG
jgi:hypothetical protein